MTALLAGSTAGALCLAVTLSAAQAAAEFEVVSVRRSVALPAPVPGTRAARGGFVVLPDGRFEARGETLVNLARVAFGFDHVDPNRGVVQANVDWYWEDRFDITAEGGHPWTTPPPGTTVPAELRTMLRSLLEERFAMKARVETKTVDVIAVRLSKSELGPGLRPSTAECLGPFTAALPGEARPRPRCAFTNDRGLIEAQAVTMQDVLLLIAQAPGFIVFSLDGHRPLVDQTRLPGAFDLSFKAPSGVGREGAEFKREIEYQLGLRLAPARAPIPTLIIERARKPQQD
jgi:uncharacterized protein (TIGR03435 family)